MHTFDASKVNISLHVARKEIEEEPSIKLDSNLVHLAALLLDIHDKKYLNDASQPL